MGWFTSFRSQKLPWNAVLLDEDLASRFEESTRSAEVNSLLREHFAPPDPASDPQELPFWLSKEEASDRLGADEALRNRVRERRTAEQQEPVG